MQPGIPDSQVLLLALLTGAFLTAGVDHVFTYLTDRSQKLSLFFAIWIFIGLIHHVLDFGGFYPQLEFPQRQLTTQLIILAETYSSILLTLNLVYGRPTRQAFIVACILLTVVVFALLLPAIQTKLFVGFRIIAWPYRLFLLYLLWKLKRPGTGLLIGASVLYSVIVAFFGSGPVTIRDSYPNLSLAIKALGYIVCVNMYSAYLGILASLTNKQLAESEVMARNLREMDKMKTNFFSGITHEFRTPLTLIQGPATELQNSTDPNARQLGGLISRNADRLLRLINQLLDLSRLEARELNLKSAPVDLATLVQGVISQFASTASSRSIDYQHEIATPLPIVQGDKERIETILSNILSNSIKFTQKGGSIHIHTAWKKDKLVFQVRDTGRGIPADKLERIFDRFYQIKSEDASPSEGTGIGLALVKEFTERMKGVIDVESQPGVGTKFTIELPFTLATATLQEMVPENGRAKADEVAVLQHESEPGSPVILLVDDTPDILTFIKTCLGPRYTYLEAYDGKTGLELARKDIPDFVISDLMMPVMDGFEFCRNLKSDPRTDHIPFIMLTARADEASKLEGLLRGADDYLTKPFNKSELLLKVENILKLRERMQVAIRHQLLAQASPVTAESESDRFVQRARSFVENNMKDEQLNVEALASELNLGREQCYRKLMALTGMAPSAFIRTLRLQRANELLKARWGQVSQVAYEVGIDNLSYFTRAFKELYGQLPSEVAQNK